MSKINHRSKVRRYDRFQKILLVGEGDFSFSNCLAQAFVKASNITATSLDSRDTVISKYPQAEENLLNLEARGALVLHGVSVRTMDEHPQLINRTFHRIVFNFPHSGDVLRGVRETDSCYIKYHQRVVRRFFNSASHMLKKKGGEIHVTHKTSHPYDRWDIVELAKNAGLELRLQARFDVSDYPGYVNRKGFGSKWNATFPSGDASSFIFCCKSVRRQCSPNVNQILSSSFIPSSESSPAPSSVFVVRPQSSPTPSSSTSIIAVERRALIEDGEDEVADDERRNCSRGRRRNCRRTRRRATKIKL